ncbi:6,7-dimethyl-8-ribityllumazine synthase [Candidatus Margulisiibacteriota bacterium]
MNIYEGNLDAKKLKIAIIVSRFNSFISERLQEGAIDCLKRHGIDDKAISIFKVPGSFEIPLIAKNIAKINKFDAIICLGAIIRGQTPHFDYVATETTKGIAAVSLDESIPIGFGIITSDTIEQAIERAGTKAGNKGWDAALSIIEMANLQKNIK